MDRRRQWVAKQPALAVVRRRVMVVADNALVVPAAVPEFAPDVRVYVKAPARRVVKTHVKVVVEGGARIVVLEERNGSVFSFL